jgi:hypothetical protein
MNRTYVRNRLTDLAIEAHDLDMKITDLQAKEKIALHEAIEIQEEIAFLKRVLLMEQAA